jgi:hypothetical protein
MFKQASITLVGSFYHSISGQAYDKHVKCRIRLLRGLITSLEVHLTSNRHIGIWDSSFMQGLLNIIFRNQKPVNMQQAFITAAWVDFWSPDPEGQPIPEMQEFTKLLLLVLESQESSTDIPFRHCSMHECMVMAVEKFVSDNSSAYSRNLSPRNKRALRKIARAWYWYANRMLDVQRSRLTDTCFLCLLHTWLTTRVESFWPSALEVLEGFIAADGDDIRHHGFLLIKEFSVLVFFVREEANELQPASVLDRDRMKNVILALLQFYQRHHKTQKAPWEKIFLRLHIMSSLTLLSCLPPDGSRAVLEAVWEWHETILNTVDDVERGPSALLRAGIEKVLEGAVSVTTVFHPLGMIFTRITDDL